MSIRLNHTIVNARDPEASAVFLAEMLGLPAPTTFGHFQVVATANDVSLDFLGAGDAEIRPQHYAFLIDEDEFDAVFGRIQARGLDYWADPFKRQPGEINRRDGGRGVYFDDPNGHYIEILTRRTHGG